MSHLKFGLSGTRGHGPNRDGPHPSLPFQELTLNEVFAIKGADEKKAVKMLSDLNFCQKGRRHWLVIRDEHGMRVKRVM